MSNATAVAILAGPVDEITIRTEAVLQKFSAALGKLPNAQAREAALRLLKAPALPELKEARPNVWQSLFAKLNPEVAETIGFLEPVCCVFESNGRTLLDALPPEQREFAVEVLTKLEPKEKDALPKPEKVKRKPDRKFG